MTIKINTEGFLDRKVKLYLLVMGFLIIVNLLTSSHFWFIYPLLGWGIPLFYKKFKSMQISSQ